MRHCVFIIAVLLSTAIVCAEELHHRSWLYTIPPINEQQLETFSRWLDLEPSQRELLSNLHEQYRARRSQLSSEPLQRFNEVRKQTLLSAEASEIVLPTYVEATASVAQLNASYADVDEAFLSSIEEMLIDQQRQRMWRVRNAYLRQWHRADHSQNLPEGTVDLVAIIDQAMIDEDTVGGRDPDMMLKLSREEHDRFLVVMKAFEDEFITALQASSQADQRAEPLEIERYGVSLALLFGSPRESERQRLRARRDDLRADIADILAPAAKHLETTVHNGFLRLRDALPEDQRETFTTLYFQAAYPTVHPDPESAEHLYEAALQLDDLTDDQRESLLAFREDFRAEHRRLLKQLREGMREYRLLQLQRDGGATLRDYAQTMDEVEHELRELNAKQLEIITPLLTEPQQGEMPEWRIEFTPRLPRWRAF